MIQGVGEGEQALARAVVSASEGAAELAPKTVSAADLAALLVKCRIFVGADSGPLHLASVLGVPGCADFGPYRRDSERTVRGNSKSSGTSAGCL